MHVKKYNSLQTVSIKVKITLDVPDSVNKQSVSCTYIITMYRKSIESSDTALGFCFLGGTEVVNTAFYILQGTFPVAAFICFMLTSSLDLSFRSCYSVTLRATQGHIPISSASQAQGQIFPYSFLFS